MYSIFPFSAMKPEFLNLFRELCEEQVMLYVDPEGVKAKKKQRKIDFEVSDLRLKLANTMGKNVVLSNREIRLLRYVNYLCLNYLCYLCLIYNHIIISRVCQSK